MFADYSEDPEGVFYYNHTDSLDPIRTIKYQSSRFINPSDGKVCASIKFYTTSVEQSNAEVRCDFLFRVVF